MSHTCRGVIVHCMDFRFGPDLKKFMEDQGLLGDCDIVSFAGAAKNILEETTRAFAMRQIELSQKLHGMEEVHLVNHMDCGAYGGHGAFPDIAAEHAFQVSELEKAETIIKASFPDLTVVKWLADIQEQGHEQHISFEKIG